MLPLVIEPAIPSLITLTSFFFIPKIARSTHRAWRAVQVFDRQQRDAPLLNGKYYTIPWLNIISLPVMIIAKTPLHEVIPMLIVVKENIPDLILAVWVNSIISCAIYYHTLSDRLLWRVPNTTALHLVDVHLSKSWILHKFVVSPPMLVRAVLYMICFTLLKVLGTHNKDALLHIASFSGIHGQLMMSYMLPACTGGSSLQQMVKRPPFAFKFLMAITGGDTLIKVAIYIDKEQTKHFVERMLGSTITHIARTDVACMQYVALTFAWLWNHLVMTCTVSLLCIAYAYDAEQAGLGTVDNGMADSIIEFLETLPHADKLRDTQGRVGINLLAPTYGEDIYPSRKQLPTYNAAFATLIACQILGTIIEISAPWWPTLRYALLLSLDSGNSNGILYFFSIWPFFACPLMCIAMIAQVSYRTIGRDYTRLWLYKQDWNKTSGHNSLVDEVQAVAAAPILQVPRQMQAPQHARKTDFITNILSSFLPFIF